MKKLQLKKRFAAVLAGTLSLALVGSIWAYYHAENKLENKLKTKQYGGEQLVEKFTPDEDWNPGETVTKEASIENTGDAPLFVRVKLNEKWTRNDLDFITLDSGDGIDEFTNANFIAGSGQLDATDGATAGDGSVVVKTLGSSKWVYSTADGYWYYSEVLQPVGETGDKTDLFLRSITLATDADMGLTEEIKYYTSLEEQPENNNITDDPETGWVVFTGAVPDGATYSRSVSDIKTGFAGYTGADYSLLITYETYQATTEARGEAVNPAGGKWDPAKTPILN